MNAADPSRVELGTCGPRLMRCQDDDRTRLLHVPGIDAIVLREHRQPGGWRCTVIARRDCRFDVGHVDVTDDELAIAHTSIAADPAADPDRYMMLWQTRVTQYSRGGAAYLGARALANDIRRPGTVVVDLDDEAVLRLLQVTRLRPPGLKRLLARLVGAGLLTPTLPGVDGRWGAYIFAAPDVPAGPDTYLSV
jgi:hypothetical protein